MSDKPRLYGDVLTFEIEGLEEVQKRLNELSDSMRAETARNMVQSAGEFVAERIRENIRLNFWRHSTGMLESSVFVTVMTNEEGAASYISPNTDYAAIHEFGGEITPKNAKALSWIGDDGERVFASRVVIPARPYIAPAIESSGEEIVDIMNEEIDYAISAAAFDI